MFIVFTNKWKTLKYSKMCNVFMWTVVYYQVFEYQLYVN